MIEATLGVVMTTLTVDPAKVRAMIEALDRQGIDGKAAYRDQVSRRPRDWPPAPSLAEVMQPQRSRETAMREIPMREVSPEFAECWQAAGLHLQQQGEVSWLRAHLHPPILEDLSFRLGNQLFFVSLDVERLAPFSAATARALRTIADGCRGHACLMPMRKTSKGWQAAAPGWGLLDLVTSRPVDPPALCTGEKIEMSAWELQDFAVQIVREQLEREGRKLMSWQGNPDVDPSLWFVGDRGPEWVVVRAARYPEKAASPPANWAAIAEYCSHIGRLGHFASVAAANAKDPFDPSKGPPMPLWRGHGMIVSYDGLKPVTK